jgi:hypothetical protein
MILAVLAFPLVAGCGGGGSSGGATTTQTQQTTVTSSADPAVFSWKLNTTGVTGYNSLPADVQTVEFSASDVYVSCSGIPDYTIGPWPSDPNVAKDQGFVFEIPRVPIPETTSANTATPLGPIGVLVNGVAIFNAKDANSYNNAGVWHSNAVVVEAASFDSCLGHPEMTGVYHHHQNPVCLDAASATTHSAILGFAFDGYPIYGPYAFANTNGTGGIARMTSSYAARTYASNHRTTLPDGTALTASEYGPDVSSTYPVGYYVEDFAYTAGSGDLDQFNGRFAVTPEYPGGTYAYYVTIDAVGDSAYPYIIGPEYYGVVDTNDTQTQGHASVPSGTTLYEP